ncbi:MAG: type II restriction endonuclease [Armatimonadetes bacterium CG07_land_8_20_14_0_80_40_9]|nr:MAG: type II restriction endonuclease [Armatimonadetes bacterium CG07_land_8_20_14_0_80_40_9]
MDRTKLGSKTAKGGFANEKAICKKFNAWEKDIEAQEWLKIMGYDITKLDSVKAIQVPTRIKKSDLSKFEVNEKEYEQFVRFKKADAQIRIIIKIGNILKIENMSLKKANSDADYNQIDKRTVDDYQEMWKFDDEITFWLKLFTGKLTPKKYSRKTGIKKFRDKRRLFLNEMPKGIQDKIIKFFKRNQIMIISDIIKGRGGLSANWMLVTRLNRENKTTTWTLRDINVVMNFFGSGGVCISPKGSLYIGKITMQRKGGTPDPTKIQFKIKPCQLFNLGE